MTILSALSPHAERLVARAPKGLFRFLSVGMAGLATHTVIFTVLLHLGFTKSAAWFVGLVIGTCVTWQLNRRLTFTSTGRRRGSEALRYTFVTLVAQGVSYAVFRSVCTLEPHYPPAIALIAGAVIATAFSYSGHRFLTFAPHKALDEDTAAQEVPIV